MNHAKAQIVGILDQHMPARITPDFLANLSLCDMAELRADLLPDMHSTVSILEELRSKLPLQKWILTVRLQVDGGKWPHEKRTERSELIKKWIATGWFYALDIEVEETKEPYFIELRKFLEINQVKLIVSHHNFSQCYPPESMLKHLQIMQELLPNGIKMALYARSYKEAQQLMEFVSTLDLPELSGIFAMGTAGTPSRLISPLMGAPLTYGYLSQEAQAPGQLSAQELSAYYHTNPAISNPLEVWNHALEWLNQRAAHA